MWAQEKPKDFVIPALRKCFNTPNSLNVDFISFGSCLFGSLFAIIVGDTSSILVVILVKSTIPKVEVFFHFKLLCQGIYYTNHKLLIGLN